MLYAQAHGKCLGLHGDSPVPQHLKGIPGAVANGRHQDPGMDPLRPVDHHSLQTPFLHHKVCGSAEKAHLAPQLLDLTAHGLYDPAQHIRTDMGLIHIQYGGIRAKFHQDLQYGPVASKGILYQGIQLPVREGSCPSLPKLHIGVRVQFTALPESGHPLCPGIHILPPLQQDGAISLSCQHQAAEQACWPGSYDNGRMLQFCGSVPGKMIAYGFLNRHIPASQPLDQLFLLFSGYLPYPYIHHIAVEDVRFFSGIN